MPKLREIKKAHKRIIPYINKTPVMTSRTLDEMLGAEVYFKCENFQRAGSFKIRGAVNTISQLTPDEKSRGIIAHSSGNHAQAVALAAKILGVGATVVMPEGASSVKVEATRGYGAEVIFCEDSEKSRVETTSDLIDKFGYTLVHPFDNDNIICGAGTCALELIDEINNLDVIFSPVGGGGLVSGTLLSAKGIDSSIKIFAAEPENANDAYRSLKAGRIIKNPSPPKTIADGLRTNLSERTFAIINDLIDGIITVSEDEIISAMRILWERMKLVVEPSGAVSLAGLLKGKVDVKGKKIGVILSGGNIDLGDFFDILRRKISR